MDAVLPDGPAKNALIRTPKDEYFNVPVFSAGEVVEQPARPGDAHPAATSSESNEFIRANRARPFFLYLAHHLPHVPLFAHDEHAGHAPRGAYADVDRGDRRRRRPAARGASPSLGLGWNTAPRVHERQRPLARAEGPRARGAVPRRKGTTFEGGVRVPGAVPVAGHGEAGRRRRDGRVLRPAPTFAALAGAPLPADRVPRRRRPDARPTRDGHEPAQDVLLLRRLDAPGRALGSGQGPLRDPRGRLRRSRRSRSTRRGCTTSTPIRPSATTWPPNVPTSWPRSRRSPTGTRRGVPGGGPDRPAGGFPPPASPVQSRRGSTGWPGRPRHRSRHRRASHVRPNPYVDVIARHTGAGVLVGSGAPVIDGLGSRADCRARDRQPAPAARAREPADLAASPCSRIPRG